MLQSDIYPAMIPFDRWHDKVLYELNFLLGVNCLYTVFFSCPGCIGEVLDVPFQGMCESLHRVAARFLEQSGYSVVDLGQLFAPLRL